jgi:hypothetical protein
MDGVLSPRNNNLCLPLLDDAELGVYVDEFVLDTVGGPVSRGCLRSTTIVGWIGRCYKAKYKAK